MVVRTLIQLSISKDWRLQIKFHIDQDGSHIYPRSGK